MAGLKSRDMKRGRLRVIIVEPPNDVPIRSRTTCGFGAEARAEHRGLGDRRGVDPDEELVDQLDHLARADRTAQLNVLAEGLQDGQRLVEARPARRRP